MGQRLYVGNLSFHTTEDSIRSAFAEVDSVTEVRVITDRETGRSRGFAFVTMESPGGAEKAIAALNGAVVDGRPLRVNEAEERNTRGGDSNGGARRGGHRGW